MGANPSSLPAGQSTHLTRLQIIAGELCHQEMTVAFIVIRSGFGKRRFDIKLSLAVLILQSSTVMVPEGTSQLVLSTLSQLSIEYTHPFPQHCHRLCACALECVCVHVHTCAPQCICKENSESILVLEKHIV